MKSPINLIAVLLIAGNILVAQQTTTEFPKLSGPYLGQKPPGMKPELFGPGIVSTGNHEHSRLVISNDVKEMYWIVIPFDPNITSDHGNHFNINNQNIFFTTNRNGEWTKPDVLPLTKQLTPNALALGHENKLYFQVYDQETDPKESPRPTKLFAAEKNKNQWGNPQLADSILPKVKGKTSVTLCFADNGNLFYDYGGPDEAGGWSWDIYIRECRDGKYQEPKLLASVINDGKVNWCPWISPDESYIIWSSHREGSYGSGDLYISFKNNEGSWNIPMNMGNKINTEGQERFPSVSADGKYLFFARHTDNITYSDFYWVDAKIIEELKPKELK